MKKTILLLGILVLLIQTAAATCIDEVKSTNTVDFLDEIPDLNAKLGTCDATVPSPADKFFKSERILIEISMEDGSEEAVTVTTQDGKVTEVSRGSPEKPTYKMSIGECELDALLSSQDKMGVVSYLYLQKKLELRGVGFWRRLKFGVSKIFAKGLLKKKQMQVELDC